MNISKEFKIAFPLCVTMLLIGLGHVWVETTKICPTCMKCIECVEPDTVYIDSIIYDTIIVVPDVLSVYATKYQPNTQQCDGTPLITGDGSVIDTISLKEKTIRWCALSQDLLWFNGGPYHYGDTVYVESPIDFYDGAWLVRDAINPAIPMTIDFLTWYDWPILGRRKVFIYQNI
jgi:hypothetical protein